MIRKKFLTFHPSLNIIILILYFEEFLSFFLFLVRRDELHWVMLEKKRKNLTEFGVKDDTAKMLTGFRAIMRFSF